MYSIKTQNKDSIYCRPELKKIYIQEINWGDGQKFQVRASIDNIDCLLGTYSDKEMARKIMMDLIHESFRNRLEVLCMPEDKQ